MAANSLDWYTQELNKEENRSGVTCTGVRLYGKAGNKGEFDMRVGDKVWVRMGYRIYEDENATAARYWRDYEDVDFELLGEKFEETSASFISAGVAGMLAAVTLLAF